MDILISSGRFDACIDEEMIEKASLFALEHLNCPPETELSVTFVEDDEMAKLNYDFRGKSGSTDVLSFECDNIADGFELQDEQLHDQIYTLGDIIIAPDVARHQAEQFGTSFQEEIELLLFHGILHLCGFDHIDDDDARIMETKQQELLQAWRSSSFARPAQREDTHLE